MNSRAFAIASPRERGGDRLEAARLRASERHLHAAVAAEEVHRERKVAAFDLLEEDRTAAESRVQRIEPSGGFGRVRARALREAIDDLARLEPSRDRLAHAHQLAGGVEGVDEVAEVAEHAGEERTGDRRGERLRPASVRDADGVDR
jgi:hypothetical protein